MNRNNQTAVVVIGTSGGRAGGRQLAGPGRTTERCQKRTGSVSGTRRRKGEEGGGVRMAENTIV